MVMETRRPLYHSLRALPTKRNPNDTKNGGEIVKNAVIRLAGNRSLLTFNSPIFFNFVFADIDKISPKNVSVILRAWI